MFKNKILEKLLAIFLIFTLTFANFALVTKSYAASFTEVLFGANGTGSKSVEFDAYFEVGDTKGASIISDVKNKDLSLNVGLNIKNKGYLKDAKIELIGNEENPINFEVREQVQNENQIIVDSNEEENSNVENNTISEENVDSENEENSNVQNLNSEVSDTNDSENITNSEKLASDEENLSSEENIEDNVEQIANSENEKDVDETKPVTDENNINNENDKTVEKLVEQESSIEKFENNTFYLNPIYGKSEVKMEVPIEYKNEEYVSEEKAASESKVVFTGTYVNEKGEEEEVTKEVTINVIWKDERKVEVEEEATKYIDYGEGVILQTVEKVNTGSEGKTLPVKETELEIEVPVLKDQKPSKITVVANTTKGTNGEEAGEVKFGEENWNYNEEENKLTIKVNNEKQKVEIKENEEEYLQDEETEVKEEERYVNSEGTDEYVVTYTYEGLKANEEVVKADTKVKAKMTTLSGVEKEENKNIVENEKEYNYELKGQSGNIVSLNKENKKAEASKAYTYVNYNNEGKYETEIIEDMIVNISYKEIVEGIEVRDTENAYVDKNGEEKATEDMYYKVIRIGKENFESILGENGEIKVKDEAGNEVIVINKDSEVNENGIIEIGFGEKYSRLSFETSKPEGEGNLVISTVKAIGKASIEKEELAEVEKVESKAEIIAKYSYVEQEVEVGEAKTETKLVDTNTEANLVIDRESLSTVEENKDVEMRVELNNARETSDVYGNSEFEIEMPEYVEGIEITNESILYGEGLEISKTEVEGRIIRIGIEGKQEGINSGVLTNGTNIVINANIKVNMFAPAKNEKIEMRYTNEEATNYVGEGKKEVEISYSAPRGLVAATRISNYDEEGSTVTSIKQGKQEGTIGVYGAAREAENEIIIMNNNSNTVGNISILGRIASKGVKDIISGEELGTTIDSKMTGEIISGEENRGNFIIYYSENGEATKDLEDSNNGWTREIDNIENIKSYLIVPEDSNYEMESAEVLRFGYNVTIPENLKHNETILGTYGVYYRNNSELAKTDEISIADLVGLTTGQGPELKLTVTPSKNEVKEYEELCITAVIENVGQISATNVNADFYLGTGLAYIKYISSKDNTTIERAMLYSGVIVNIPEIEAGEKVELKIFASAGNLNNGIEYTDEVNEDGSYNIVENISEKKLNPKVTVSAEELKVNLEDEFEVTIKSANIAVSESSNTDLNVIKRFEDLINIRINVENKNTSKEMTNIVINKTLPKELELVSSTVDYTYDESTSNITWNIQKIEANRGIVIDLVFSVKELDENITKTSVTTFSTVKADGTETYTTNEISFDIAKPVLTIVQTSNIENTYIKEGDVINYKYLVKNDGEVVAYAVNLTNTIPDGITIRNIYYNVNGVENNRSGTADNDVTISTNLAPGEEMMVNLEGVALSLNGAEEKSIVNYATVQANQVKTLTSNSITYIVETSNSSNGNSTDDDSFRLINNDITKTYKISGLAWFDENQNGMRDTQEKMLSGITVKLVDSNSGVIKQTQTTGDDGSYVFTGLVNGNYLIVFEYDSSKYTVTTYQKQGIISNVNSDVILTTINQDGKTKEGAVTDIIKIENGSISNIDMGLILSDKFDLKLDKTISKVVVQNSKELTTDNYDNVKLAKAEIPSKYVSGSTVYVEYTITVSNVGDIAGYAKKIVDYLPEGMTFNSSLESNKDWYTGKDGNLYSEKLADQELKSGESVSLKLVLTKQMTEENTGIVNNIAEIYEDYNKYGVSDTNSTPANKKQNENDLSSADVVISIKTGEVLIYISIIVTTIMLGSIVIFIVSNKLIIQRRKWVM